MSSASRKEETTKIVERLLIILLFANSKADHHSIRHHWFNPKDDSEKFVQALVALSIIWMQGLHLTANIPDHGYRLNGGQNRG